MSNCTPRYRADGWRLIGGCRGPQPDWTWTKMEWPELDKHGEPTGNTCGLDFAICPDCEALWDRHRARFAVSLPTSPLHLAHLRMEAAL